MGVPALFRWLSQKYPKIIGPVIEDRPQEIDGVKVPVDTTKPNPNGKEFDNLYLDMNGIVHPCSHPEDRPAPETEEEMMLSIFEYTDRVVNMVRPRKLLMIAVDGVAPRAKMNQQRSRRFRSAKEAKEKDEDKAELIKMLKAQNQGVLTEAGAETMSKKTWDSNAITPGTPFMDLLAMCLRYWCSYKLNTDPGWANMKVIISDASVPGEGEHKIMEFVRSQRSSPSHDPNTRHVIYGLDADLIMLGLATHEPHFHVLREDVFAQDSKPRTCRICGQKGHMAEECRGEAKQKEGEFDEKSGAAPEKPFIWLHVSVLREYLGEEMYVPGQEHHGVPFDLERALDDWVFMCFFVGNDFLPHLPSLEIRENGIDTLIAIWRDNLPLMRGYVTKDGQVDLARAQFILDGLAKQEDAIFKKRRQVDEKRDANAKRRQREEEGRKKRRSNGRKSPDYGSNPIAASSTTENDPPASLPLFAPAHGEMSEEFKQLTHDMVVNRGAVFKANQANKSAAAVLKAKLLGQNGTGAAAEESATTTEGDDTKDQKTTTDVTALLGKRKAELMEEGAGEPTIPGRNSPLSPNTPKVAENEPAPDTVRLWEDGYADRYYEQKFGADPKNVAFRNKVAAAYVEGLAWVLLYYFQGCPSWKWYYPYHYAPFAADFVDLDKVAIKFEKGTPFKPYEQLMGVMPAASAHTIPDVFHGLMKDEDSEIKDFYPEDFPIDLNGKKFAWQGVALLPFIDPDRLLKAMAKHYPKLSQEDVERNKLGKDALIFSDKHPLYDDVTAQFYSKKQGAPKHKLDPKISKGLAGHVEKNEDYLPGSPLVFPLETAGMPNLDEDRSISVSFEFPKSSHVHKSMLLRGVKLEAPALDRSDIESTRSRAQHSGRSFGGAPLGGRGGRGGRINFADNRPNPFEQFVQPGYGPPQHMGRPPPRQAQNFNHPPPQGFASQQGYPPYGGGGGGNHYNGGPPPQNNGYPPNMYGQPPPQHRYPLAPPPGTYGSSQGYGHPNNQQQRYNDGHHR